MQRRRLASKQAILAALVAFTVAAWASVFACSDPHGGDGAGGQSGDEGRSPRWQVLGTGGGAAQPPEP